ncbi:MAG: peptidoglycan recognition family protein [Agathobacter sp.]|nr:peptidoglycan recognition family protein [Agathobacter sp.]
MTRLERKKQLVRRMMFSTCFVFALLLLIVFITNFAKGNKSTEVSWFDYSSHKKVTEKPVVDEQMLPINDFSRPGIALDDVNGIVVHYTANPGTTAQQNHDYFEGLAENGDAYVSSNYIIGLSGEIIQCIPDNEMSYASNDRNHDTIAIECCIPDETGAFNGGTYDSLVWLVAWLVGEYDLDIDDVIRHYDVTGKNCPKYYVENPDAWERFKQDVVNYIDENGVEE